MEKDLNLFFADELRKRTLTDEQSITLQEVLFPGWDDDPNKARMESAKDMTAAYTLWAAEQAKKPQEEKVKPMSDEEIENLASIMC